MCACVILICLQPIFVHVNGKKMKNLSKLAKANINHQGLKSQQGVVLLEALIAILIFSMGVLAVAGLQGAMLKNTTDSKYRADASYIAQKRLATMWVDPPTADTTVTDEDVSALLPNGKLTSTYRVADGIVRIVVKWQLPGEVVHNYETNARIAGV